MNSIKKANHEPVDGILVVDKPAGWTSHDVVNRIRNLFGGVKTGHTGTLDPMATGVLVLLVGRATKLASQFTNDSKRYLAEVTFGNATDSYDATGKITTLGNPETIDRNLLIEYIRHLVGESKQTPPMFSAVKIGGKKLYHLARSGKTVERRARTISIDSIEADLGAFPTVRLDIVCSKGTYIRSIAHELGEKIGCPAHLSALRRVASGSFTIHEAVDFAAVNRLPEAAELFRQFIIPVSESITTV